MTLSIAATQIQQPSRLSAPARACLGLIDGGIPWLHWAIQSPVQHFRVPDETRMLCDVQQGLHGDPLCLLPAAGLLVSPAKLMTMGEADLRTLLGVEAQADGPPDAVLDNQLASLVARHRLVRGPDIAALQAWFGQLGLAGHPLFHCLSIDDAAALIDLMRASPSAASVDTDEPAHLPDTPSATVAAAAFAAREARSPMEFVDYLRFYQVLSARNLATQAQALLQVTLPELFGSLECPQLHGLPSPDTVVQVVRSWYAQSRQLGFSRLSLGALRMVQRTGYPGGDAAEVKSALWRYMTSAQILLSSIQDVTARMGQDGRTCTYELERGAQRAVLCLDKHGVISLDDFVTDTTPNALSDGRAGASTAIGAPASAAKPDDSNAGGAVAASFDSLALGNAA